MNLRPLTLIGIVISMVCGIGLGISGYQVWLDAQEDSSAARTFDEVLQHVQSSYVDEVDRNALVTSALRGMLDNLDAHSNYLDVSDFRDLQVETSGRFGGVGIELGLVDDYFTIITPIQDTPASRADLRAGDRILEIDHISLRERKLTEVVDLLRGEPGSDIHMRIRHQDEIAALDKQMVRASIEIASVYGRLLEPGYGYIRISQFQNRTGEEFAAQLKDLIEQNQTPLDGLVLDLRNNPGGVLQASVTVADAFLEDGLIVYTEGRLPSSHLKYRASGKDKLDGAPVVVLINDGSASAAEIVAGALQDHARAMLLGTRSYGKGSVQSVVPLSGERAIKLTTAYYYTPNGRSIHMTGIEPDIAVELITDETELLAQAIEILKRKHEPAPRQGLHARL